MPAGMTFTTLIQQLQSYLERGNSVVDPTVYQQLPMLVNLAERAIARRLKISGMIIPIIGTLTAGVSVYQKPNGWRRTTSMNYGIAQAIEGQYKREIIFPRSYEYCREYWPNDSLTEPPEFYTDYDYEHWLITPTPDQNYPWEIEYYGLPALLDDTNTTNFWTKFAPETLLYRSLLECTPFLKNDERIPVWDKMYKEAVTNLGQEDLTRVVDRASVRKED